MTSRMPEQDYTLKFTAGAGLVAESVKTAELFCEYQDWSKVREAVIASNTFQSRTRSTLVRLYREVQGRLEVLSNDEMALLTSGSEMDQRHVIWMAICLRYRLIREFAAEVMINRYDSAQYELSYTEYDQYFEDKADLFASLADSSVTTRKKARQVLFRMLSECGLIDESGEIRPQHLSEEFRRIAKAAGHDSLRIFPGVEAYR